MRLLNCILCLLELFYFSNQTTQNNLQIYYENETISKPDCQILGKGFYIILTENKISSSSIIGDYHLVQKNDSFDYHHFIHSDLFPNNNEESFRNQIDCFYKNSNMYYLTVDSSAVYVPPTSEEHISLFGTLLESPISSFLLGEDTETDICSPIPLQNVKEKFSAKNENGQDITDQISFVTNYKETNVILGNYYIIAKIILSSKTVLIIKKIEVKDFDAPTIELKNDKIAIQFGSNISSEEIILKNTIISDSSSSTHIMIEKDTYQDAQSLGLYEIVFHAVDDYQNCSKAKKILVELKDEIPPDITLKDNTQKIVSKSLLSEDELVDAFMVQDNYDVDLKANILEMKPISSIQYELIVTTKDQSGNETTKSFPYYVIEESLPIVHITNAIHIENPEGYTNQELLQMIQKNALYQFNDNPYLHLIDATHPISINNLKNRYQIEDELDNTLIPFDIDTDYNPKAIGVYQVTITFKNALHQKIVLKDLLWVRDFGSPVVTSKTNEIVIDLCKEWNAETFYSYFQIEDNIDKQLENIQIIGLEQLIQEGDFLIGCMAIDSSMNQSNTAYILVHAYQSIHKIILPLTLDLDTNDLTEQELLSLFLSKQEIKKGYQSLLIKTNYYHNKDGIYPTIIETSFENGNKEFYIFKIKLKASLKNKEKSVYIYLSCGIIGFLILACVILWFKRSNWLKNGC